MFTRPTAFADALINAAVKETKAKKVDHSRGTGNWVARRVALNCERPGFGVATEFDTGDKVKAAAKRRDALNARLDDEEVAGLD